MKKVILAAVGGALLTGSLLGCGAATAQQDGPYATCKDAANDGVYNIQSNDPHYASWLDRDGDGVACEKKN
jgi:hypothetical protein